MSDALLQTLIHLLVVIDPIGLVPIFLALTAHSDAAHRRRSATLAVLVGLIVLMLFTFIGESLLQLLGISMAAFRLAGGLLLFMIALEMVFERRTQRRRNQANEHDEEYRSDEIDNHADIAVFPLGVPLIAGPGAIASVMLLGGGEGEVANPLLIVIVALLLVLLLTWVLFILATRVAHVLPPTLINVITRLLGILLAALSVQFVIDGITLAFMPAGAA